MKNQALTKEIWSTFYFLEVLNVKLLFLFFAYLIYNIVQLSQVDSVCTDKKTSLSQMYDTSMWNQSI